MNDKSLRRAGVGKFALAMLMLGVIFVVEVFAAIVTIFLRLPSGSLVESLIPELAGAIAAVCGMIALGGLSWSLPSREDVAYAFRFAWWFLVVGLALTLYDSAIYVLDGTPIASDWLVRVAECTLLCLAIGVLEEFVFRGLLLNGLLALMGGTHRGVVWAIALVSVAFGLAHVSVDVDFVDTISAIQALLKIVQTGMYSIVMCVIVLRTKKLSGVSLFHGFDDFMLIMPSVGVFDETLEIDYVVEGDEANVVIFYYLLVIALYIPVVIKALRELRRGRDVYRGAFMEREVEKAQLHEAHEAMPMTPRAGEWDALMVPPSPMGAPQAAEFPATWPAPVPEPGAEGLTAYPVPAPVPESAPVPASASEQGSYDAVPPIPQPLPIPTSGQSLAPQPALSADAPARGGRPPVPEGLEDYLR